MTRAVLFVATGGVLTIVGLVGLVAVGDLVRRIVAVNVMGTGVFVVLAGLAWRADPENPDPLPHALVLTGIVVTVSITAIALALVQRVEALERQPDPPPQDPGP
ncbi:NADH-quinone oxidoreductase subunit K, partial [Blastococcus sp. KM273129]|uniref:NADH-quinone oxidoreductase subunit K n=1 Tax=Blastococcus sp. KM273129 TaxID=2570315 RepID=UPI001F3914E5